MKVYNRTRVKAQAWVDQHGGKLAGTPREAAKGAAVVLTCVSMDHDLRAVVLGENGAFAGMHAGAILVDHSTASAQLAIELAGAAATRGFAFLDAPLSGAPSGAERGTLSVTVGGEEKDFARVEPFIRHYARMVSLMGGPGAGQKAKMVHQICIAGLLQALAEGLAFAQRAGLETNKLLDVLSKGAAGSWQMENRARTMLEDRFNSGLAVDLMRKDLAIAFAEARQNHTELPVAALVDRFYARLQREGHGSLDTSSLIKLLRNPHHG
jgi:3-hydroxyisobutyrate dehydrogenase-like beta-hydroxyacid dehydrogenase